MHILIWTCLGLLLSFGNAWSQHCHTNSGELALKTGNGWDDLVQGHFRTYKRLGNFNDMLTLHQSSMRKVLEWPLAQQATHADFVTKKMSAECESAFTEFAKDALKQFQTQLAKEDGFRNTGAVCNVAFIIQQLPEGKFRSELVNLHNKISDLTRQTLEQLKLEL